MQQNHIEPFLQQGRRRIPIQGELQNDQAVVEELPLFRLHIDEEIGIGLIEVMDGDLLVNAHGVEQGRIGARTMQRRMGDDQQGATALLLVPRLVLDERRSALSQQPDGASPLDALENAEHY